MFGATLEAIRVGWRHLDTARAYENEDVVGAAIKEAIKRGYIGSVDELFITGKLWNGHMAAKDVAPALESSLEKLGIEQMDCDLNHWPWPNVHTPGCGADHNNPDAVPYIHENFMATWAELVKLKQAGKVVHLGISNHTRATTELMLRDTSEDGLGISAGQVCLAWAAQRKGSGGNAGGYVVAMSTNPKRIHSNLLCAIHDYL